MNCRRCGAELKPGQGQVNSTVDQILDTSLNAARGADGVCPMCGHYTLNRRGRRKRILFGLLKALLLVATAVEIVFYTSRTTERAAAAKAALSRINASPEEVEFLGKPIKIKSGVSGDVRPDETGWKEARLTIPSRARTARP